MAGTAKNRTDLYADIVSIVTDGGELNAAEMRELLDNIIASFANLDDDLIPGAHDEKRAYDQGDMCTKNARLLVAHEDVPIGAFDPTDWRDPEYKKETYIITVAGGAGGTVDCSAAVYERRFRIDVDGGAATITDMNGLTDKYIYRIEPASGDTITMTHTGIAGATGGQMVHKGGANLVLVGRPNGNSDWVEYLWDASTDMFIELNSAVYP